MNKICSEKKCTACGICSVVCPKKCISLILNKQGRLTPRINEALCVECGLCKQSCHNNRQFERFVPMNSYAMRYEGPNSEFSSSGAISYLLSNFIIKYNGVVYGAGILNGNITHIRIDREDEVAKIQGSKYVQSIVDKQIYISLKNDAKNERLVLFSGTGCQIAAVKSYLDNQTKNIFFLEILCHGTPSSSYLMEYIKHFTRIQPDAIKFRDKSRYVIEAYKGNELIFSQNLRNSMYLQAFLHDIILHPSCYNCNFSGKQRIGDITVGDFWGHSLNGQSCSAVLINTEYGAKIIKSIIDYCLYEEIDFYDIVKQNKPLNRPASHNISSRIFSFLHTIWGFWIALNVSTFQHRIKNYILRVLNK